LENKISELESNSKNKNIKRPVQGKTEFKKGYQPGTNSKGCEG